MANKELNEKKQQFLFYEDKDYILYKGKMQDVLSTFEENSIDSIVCDPPYELNFMSKGWDNQGIAFLKDTWEHCFRVLKDGGYLLAFGGTRTFHRIACAIEDAGFEIRDTIMWLYGSGFPKSMNIGLAIDKKNGVESEVIGKGKSGKKETHTNSLNFVNGSFGGEYEIKKCANEWQGWGTCLKPAYEPIIVARKPFNGSLVDNIMKNGVGGINIDECRIPTSDDLARINKTDNGMFGVGKNNNKAQQCKEQGIEYGGRFPSNVILTYDETDFEEACGGFPNTNPSKQVLGGANRKSQTQEGRISAGGWKETNRVKKTEGYNDNGGSASRYFYCAKASKKDRDEGLDLFDGQYQLIDDVDEKTINEIKRLLNL